MLFSILRSQYSPSPSSLMESNYSHCPVSGALLLRRSLGEGGVTAGEGGWRWGALVTEVGTSVTEGDSSRDGVASCDVTVRIASTWHQSELRQRWHLSRHGMPCQDQVSIQMDALGRDMVGMAPCIGGVARNSPPGWSDQTSFECRLYWSVLGGFWWHCKTWEAVLSFHQ